MPALLGAWWFREQWRRDPGAWVLIVLGVMLGLLLVRVALGIHYLSERHTLVLVVMGSVWAAAGLVRMADALGALVERRRPRLAPAWVLPVGFMVLTTGWCLPVALKPLHANRAGHRAAGEWLARHAGPADRIVDPYCWAHFYAGRVSFEMVEGDGPAGREPLQYVVLTDSNNLHARLTGLDKAKDLAREGEVVFRWRPTGRQLRRDRAEEVVIWAVKLDKNRPAH
jgi:hypothetical protein